MVRDQRPRGSPLWALAVLALLLATSASTAADAERPHHETHAADEHPAFESLPTPPTSIRLHAQLSGRGDAYLTPAADILPGSYTAPAGQRDGPAVLFDAFASVGRSTDDEVRFTARTAHTAWDADLARGTPFVADWLLSTGERGTDAHTALPPLEVTTTIQAIDSIGLRTTLARGTTRVTLDDGLAPSRVHLEMPTGASVIPAGSRLQVALDWSWMDDGVRLRPPAVTVHPGSYVEMPIREPVRVERLQERLVGPDLFVQARITHLFAAEHLATGQTNLIIRAPHIQVQGGRPLVQIDHEGERGGHAADFDWQVPLGAHELSAGAYTAYVTAGQVEEAGPRVIAERQFTLGTGAATVAEAPALPIWILMGLVLLGAARARSPQR